MSNSLPSLPFDLKPFAFLLDVDGTILDLAPTPRGVFVSHELRDTLTRLWQRTDGGVAFVSGRPVSELDLIFSPLQLPAIGGHGAQLRTTARAAPGTPRPPAPAPPLEPPVFALPRGGPRIILAEQSAPPSAPLPPAPRTE